MKRQTYIYTLIPLYAALSFVRTLVDWCGPLWALVIGSLLCVVVWGVVWIRLYGDGRVRPELAVLSVLPTICYLGLEMGGEETISQFSTPAWQNMYFLTWCASAAILIMSVRATPAELKGLSKAEKRRASGLTYILAAFIILYTGLTWMGTAADLFSHTL